MAKLYNQDHLIAGRLRICSTAVDRTRGLLGTRQLDDDQAVWILHCNSIHSFFMLMTIDVAFLDDDLNVVKVLPNFTPFRLCLPVRGATSVIEGSVGMIQRGTLQTGTQLRVEEA